MIDLRDHITLIEGAPAAPPPIDDLRRALQHLVAFEYAHPAVWEFAPELRAAERCLWRAVWALLLDVDHVVVAVAIDPNEKGT